MVIASKKLPEIYKVFSGKKFNNAIFSIGTKISNPIEIICKAVLSFDNQVTCILIDASA